MNELIQHALNTLSFVLPANGEFTFQEWAKKLGEIYDNEQVDAIISALEEESGRIVRENGKVVDLVFS